MDRRFAWILVPLLLGLPTAALAHLDMTKPVSRYGPDVLKTGPCGIASGERSDNINYFEPGATIDVEWYEYVDHPAHYRVSFDEDGDDDFVDPATMMEFDSNDAVLLDGIEDHDRTEPRYSVRVELPNVACDRCTLQLIQVMYDKPPYEVGGNDIYYQCADLVLEKGAPTNPDAGTEPDAGNEPDAGVDGDAGTGEDPGSDGPGESTGGSCAASGASSAGLIGWFALILAARRLARGHGFPV